jgi:hypothetical protein
MSGNAGDSIDPAIRTMLELAFGTEEVQAGTAINYKQGLPSFSVSMARVSTIFGEYYTGGYTKELGFTFPGDGPATVKHSGKLCKGSIAGIAKVAAPVNASAQVGVTAGEENGYTGGSFVMAMDNDGRTILAGADGSLSVVSTDDVGHNVQVSSPVTIPTGGFLVPWYPGAMQQTARENVYTDLVGHVKLHQGGSQIDVTNVSFTFNNDTDDLDNIFGKDANAGRAYGKRATGTLSVTMNLSNENYREIVQARLFKGFTPEIVLGDVNGRHLKITASKWIPSIPALEVPESGLTPVTLEGVCYESAPGMRDPFVVSFR